MRYLLILALALVACADRVGGCHAIGRPCQPRHPEGRPCITTDSAGCFLGTEVYLDTAPVAGGDTCLVHHFSERPTSTPAEHDEHIYTTCRCGVPAGAPAAARCTCPDGFSCQALFGIGADPAIAGSYCVRDPGTTVAPAPAEGACPASGVAGLYRPLQSPFTAGPSESSADLLFAVDNSNSMRESQRQLGLQFRVLIDQLVNPPINPATGRPTYPAVRSLNVGVISTDLGTPGSTVASCRNGEAGDDGLLNPVRFGPALREHEPWTTLEAGDRPARCGMDPDQYPSFLSFGADGADPAALSAFAEDFVCNAFLSINGCGLEQPLEAVYRALVLHDPRDRPGNTDPNAGFVRNDALLAILVISDEDDMSVRDCRHAERGRPCTDALSVFDQASTQWSSSDLNLRAYLYRPGSDQDPTWPLDRYIDPTDPARGFLSLKPGHPDLVLFSAIAGVPINLPLRGDGTYDVDWDALLGRSADGSDGFTAMSPEGPVSMRATNQDPQCPLRVVPACRREGSTYDPAHPPCDTFAQSFAWPARRIAQVARRFADTYGSGIVTSICRNDFSNATTQLVMRVSQRVGSCSRLVLPTVPPRCTPGSSLPGCASESNGLTVRLPCAVRETLPAGDCDPAHGRHPLGRTAGDRAQCRVDQVAAPIGRAPATGHGFYYDTAPDSSGCPWRLSFTPGDLPPPGTIDELDCALDVTP